MTLQELEEQVQQLTEQQKQAEVNYHQVTGALAVSQQLLEKEKEKTKDSGKKNNEECVTTKSTRYPGDKV